MVVEDVRRAPFFAALPATKELGIRSYVGVPVTRTNGAFFGTLCGVDRPTHRRSATELAALRVLARLVAFHRAEGPRRLGICPRPSVDWTRRIGKIGSC